MADDLIASEVYPPNSFLDGATLNLTNLRWALFFMLKALGNDRGKVEAVVARELDELQRSVAPSATDQEREGTEDLLASAETLRGVARDLRAARNLSVAKSLEDRADALEEEHWRRAAPPATDQTETER